MNKIIIDNFIELYNKIKFDSLISSDKKIKLKNSFRLNKLKFLIDYVNNLNFNISSVDQLKNIPNIGKGILNRIDEIIKTKKLKELEDIIYDEKFIENINNLLNIYGIGYNKAYELIKKNIINYDSLKNDIQINPDDYSKNIKLGVKYYNDYIKKIPRNEIDEYKIIFDEILLKYNLIGQFVGSYRRELKELNDIDLLIYSKTNNQSDFIHFLLYLKEKKYIIDDLTNINNQIIKYMGFSQLSINNIVRRIDIRFFLKISFYFGLLYFTGSKNFNKKMRQIAKENNYKLNEYKLIDLNTNKAIKVKSEEDIFKKLYMEYIEPKNRL